MLGPCRDALGGQKLQVDLRITAQEKESLYRLHSLIGDHLHRLGLGKLVTDGVDPEVAWQGLTDSSHHMGTTRMGLNPQRSVVDANCRVHGVSNLYIAGSSVFPTGGHANPTLTLVALALKLSHHLQTQVLPTEFAPLEFSPILGGVPQPSNVNSRNANNR
jgi:choline dehydrogenase-like flavoprotein